VHADDVEEGLAVDVEAGAGSAGDVAALLRERGGGAERRAGFGDAGGLPVGVAAEDGGEGGGEVAAGVGVVGQAEGHEQRAEVGVAEAERAVVVRVLGDHLGGVAGVVDDDLHRGGDDGDGVAIGGDVELAAGVRNFSRLKLARLQAESSRNMYSEQGLEALMRAVFLLVCQRLMVVSYCMPGSPHCQVASAILCMRSRAL
jgi:hypothetical protein